MALPSEWSDWDEATTAAPPAPQASPSEWSAWDEATTWAPDPPPAGPSAWSDWDTATTWAEPAPTHYPWRLITEDGSIPLIPRVVAP